MKNGWREGTIGIPAGGGYTACKYWVKQYETGSEYGIDGGRISKLEIRIDDRKVCHYDRGWDIKPTCAEAEAALAILMKEFN